MGKPKRKDTMYGYFAVEVITVTKNVWSFYRTTSPAKARTAALAKNCALEVTRVVMITKTQYETGLHNLEILEKRRNAAPQHQRRIAKSRNEKRTELCRQRKQEQILLEAHA